MSSLRQHTEINPSCFDVSNSVEVGVSSKGEHSMVEFRFCYLALSIFLSELL